MKGETPLRISLSARLFLLYSRFYTAKALRAEYGRKDVNNILRETRDDFERMLPELPSIGRSSPSLSDILAWSAWILSLYSVLLGRKRQVRWIGELVLEANNTMVRSIPGFAKRAMKRTMFLDGRKERMAEWCRVSRKREYPGNWVADFVPGAGGFEYGVDYVECGICKLYERHGAMDLVPWLCKTDFNLAESVGYTLERSRTLAEGSDRCDFRYHR